MADLYELTLSMDLPRDLSDAEVSELRRHLGLGPRPAEPAIVTGFAEPVIGDDGRPTGEMEGEPYPLLAGQAPPGTSAERWSPRWRPVGTAAGR